MKVLSERNLILGVKNGYGFIFDFITKCKKYYYKMRQLFYYKMPQLLQNLLILLQNPNVTFVTNASVRTINMQWCSRSHEKGSLYR